MGDTHQKQTKTIRSKIKKYALVTKQKVLHFHLLCHT